MSTARFIVVDDHPLFRSALSATLSGTSDAQVEEAATLDELSAALERNRECDLILLDLNMPGARGFSGLLLLRAQYPDIPVVIVSAVEDPATISTAIELGAAGYLTKSSGPVDIRDAIDKVLAG